MLLTKRAAWASAVVPGDGAAIKTRLNPIQGLLLWATLFLLSALMHSAESAITKISVWQIQEMADEEGPKSPFATLQQNLTSLLITILLTTTACSIYSTALFITSVSALFPSISLGTVTAALTAITLFFGELLPKAIAVNKSETVARKLLPVISRMAFLFTPLTSTVTLLSDFVLSAFGLRGIEDGSVSEDMLRRVVEQAQKTENGIETGEGRMIKGVLDMQDKEVGRIMRPRVEILAVSEALTAGELLQKAVAARYSRIPVFRGDIDHIVGLLFAKDLLDYVTVEGEARQEDWQAITARQLMAPVFFIPETMSCWDALQEMKRRRVHMAIVVDEYGGTAGLVTFEDILEEVVGEIYDEDDDREDQQDDWTILKRDNDTFLMKAAAELDDVCEALNMDRETEVKEGEYSTLGGLLCSIAGRIPRAGDRFPIGAYDFIVASVEDNRRLVDVIVQPMRPLSSQNRARGDNRGEDVTPNNSSAEDLLHWEPTSENADSNNHYANSNSNHNGGNRRYVSYYAKEDADSNYHSGFDIGGDDDISSSLLDAFYSSNSQSSSQSHNNAQATGGVQNNYGNSQGAELISNASSLSPQALNINESSGDSTSASIAFDSSMSPTSAASTNHTPSSSSASSSDAHGDSSSNESTATAVDANSSSGSIANGSSSSSSGGAVTSRMRFDSHRNKFLVFRDGEWVDPESDA